MQLKLSIRMKSLYTRYNVRIFMFNLRTVRIIDLIWPQKMYPKSRELNNSEYEINMNLKHRILCALKICLLCPLHARIISFILPPFTYYIFICCPLYIYYFICCPPPLYVFYFICWSSSSILFSCWSTCSFLYVMH